ncbi:MAG: hypothetical protein WA138_01670 [Parvibaculum sp.]
MTSFRVDSGLMNGAAFAALLAVLLIAGSAVRADTLGTLPAGSVVTPGTVTTTGPDGTVTRELPPSAPTAGQDGQPVGMLKAGPQPIMPPGFGATSVETGDAGNDANVPSSVNVPSFPAGKATDASVQPLKTFEAVPGRANADVVMSALSGVDASSAGLISDRDGGLGVDMWRGATRADVDHYLSILPVATSSPVINDLSRRLLLTGATPPEGQVSGTSLLAIRLDRLIASGRADLAAELGRGTMADKSSPIAIARARAALALADDNSACSELANLPAGNDPAHDEADAFSMRLSAFCQIRSGKTAEANVTFDLAREEAYDNPLFYSLAYQANEGLKLKAPVPKSLDALDVRFYSLAKRVLPDNAGAIVVPAVVKTLAQDTTLDSQIRIEAGERAVLSGVMKGDELARLYMAATFKPDEIEGAKAGLFPKSPVMQRALLFQAIRAEVMPTDRTDLMKQFLAKAEADGLYVAAVRALMPSLVALVPGSLLQLFAPTATRAFLMADDVPHARQWLALVEPNDGRDLRELSTLVRIADPAGLSPMSDEEAALIAADLKSNVAVNQNFAATEAMIYDGSGMVLPQIVLQALVDAPRSVGAPEQLLNQLHNAGLHGSVGEVVLLSLVAIGPGGPERADRQAVAQSISSLRAVHFDGEARRLALEALLGRSHAGRG